MDTNKNLYTVVYATLLVVIVAALLAFVAASLKSRQQKNIDMEKQTSFLKAVGLGADAQSAPDKVAYIQNEFAKYIVESFTVDAAGNVSDVVKGSAEEPEAIVNSPAFRVNLKEQYDLLKKSSGAEAQSSLSLKLPVFKCTLDNETVYLFSCYGAGLWGPIWGYIALKDDFNTVYGAAFDHKSETPGLGAEIATEWFQNNFKGKSIFEGNEFVSVSVMKGGATPGNNHQVDAVTGGTITSKALDETMKSWLGAYLPYIKEAKKSCDQLEEEVPFKVLTPAVADSLSLNK